jgi:DNA-binding NarL/FixJ family response regulator
VAGEAADGRQALEVAAATSPGSSLSSARVAETPSMTVLKDSRPDDLLAAVRAAAGGHVPLDPRVASALLPTREPPLTEQLSDREKQVLRLVAAGLANKQIARRLGIAESTVKVHTGNIFRRIGVTDRTSAAIWAKEHL